jgi:glycosyltransferase involved in cell wall biosynthesis
MRPLSIVHLTTFLQGGAGRAIVDLACAQRHAGHDVLVVTSRTGDGNYGNYPHYLDRLRAEAVPLLVEDSLFKRDLRLNLHVLQRLREMRAPDTVDLVHAHAATPALVGRLLAGHAGRHMAVVQTQHGWGVSKTTEQARNDVAILQNVDRVIVTSESTGRWLIECGVPPNHITAIPCGLPAEPPRVLAEDAEACLAPLRAAGMTLVGCVGSVTANKNQRLLVESLARLARRDVIAIFIGEGGESLMDAARSLGVDDRVRVLGYRPDAERWMGLFDLLVLPSLTEGQGLVVLEAFRAGTPVVASDIAALRQLVTDGETGWLFEVNQADALANTLSRAIDAKADERERIVQAARRKFLADYTLDVMVARHETLYRELL